MQTDAPRRQQAAQGAQTGLAAIGDSLLLEDVISQVATGGLITKIAGDALVSSKNAAGAKQPSVAQLLERFER